MAITFGGSGAKGEGQATLALPYPTPVGAAELLIAARCTWRDPEVTADAEPGWTVAGDLYGGTGTGTDAHVTRIHADYQVAAGGETGSVTFEQGSTGVLTNDGAIGVMLRYTKGAGTTWDVAASAGDDATHAADRAITLSAPHTVEVGDWLVAIVAVDTNGVDSADITAATFTGTATFGTVTARTSGAGSSLGRDGNIVAYDAEVTGAGTCTGFTFTTAGLQCGPVNVVRLREIPAAGEAYEQAPADSEAISDTSTATQDAARATDDQLGVTDVVEANLTGDTARTLEDPAGLADTAQTVVNATRTVADQVGITDTDNPLRLDIGETLDDELGLTDSVAVARTYAVTLNDQVGIDDTATPDAGGGGDVAPADTIPASDTTATALHGVRTPVDPVGLADAAGAVATLVRAPADQLALTDSVAVVLSRTVTVADSVAAADLASTFLGAIATPLERTSAVPAESRISPVAAASRISPVPARTEET